MKEQKVSWGKLLGVVLITIFGGLFWVTLAALFLGRWDLAARTGATFATFTVGLVLLGVAVAWMGEWMEDTERPFPPQPPQFTDEQLDQWINDGEGVQE